MVRSVEPTIADGIRRSLADVGLHDCPANVYAWYPLATSSPTIGAVRVVGGDLHWFYSGCKNNVIDFLCNRLNGLVIDALLVCGVGGNVLVVWFTEVV